MDLYTSKYPYSGKGPNQESDAFEPQEEVVLYALVTYNGDPVAGKIVAFDVRGPVNSIENITITLNNVTDSSGIARVSFSMPWPDGRPKATIFGFWNVIASVDIVGVIVTDTLYFRVGWMVELLYVKTVDLNNVLKDTFWKGERMGFRLGVRNIAMTQKTATLVVSASDELNVTFGTARLENEVIQPGESEYFVNDVVIPGSAFVGQGTAVANAFKTVQGGISVPWCPSVDTSFWIGLLHDVAVLSVAPSANEASLCQTVNVTVVVKNKGQVDESFNVSAFFNSTVIGTLWVESLAPDSERVLSFTWLLGCVQPGDYRLKAQAGPVAGETRVDDNVFVDGVVRIKPLTCPSCPSCPPTPPAPSILDRRWLLAMLFILIVVVASLLIAVVILLLSRRKRGRSEEEELKGGAERLIVQPRAPAKTCKVCGKEFPAVYTFCPYCLSFHGKDSE
jgi:hypothetical protein